MPKQTVQPPTHPLTELLRREISQSVSQSEGETERRGLERVFGVLGPQGVGKTYAIEALRQELLGGQFLEKSAYIGDVVAGDNGRLRQLLSNLLSKELDLLIIDEVLTKDKETIEQEIEKAKNRIQTVIFIGLIDPKEGTDVENLTQQLPNITAPQRRLLILDPPLLQNQLGKQYKELLTQLNQAGFDVQEVSFTPTFIQDLLRYFYTKGKFKVDIEDPRVQQKIDELTQQAVDGEMNLRDLLWQFEDSLWELQDEED